MDFEYFGPSRLILISCTPYNAQTYFPTKQAMSQAKSVVKIRKNRNFSMYSVSVCSVSELILDILAIQGWYPSPASSTIYQQALWTYFTLNPNFQNFSVRNSLHFSPNFHLETWNIHLSQQQVELETIDSSLTSHTISERRFESFE